MPSWDGKDYSYDDQGMQELTTDMLQLLTTSAQVMHPTGDFSYVQNTDLKKWQAGINQMVDYLGINPIAVSGEWDESSLDALSKFKAFAKVTLPSQPQGEPLGENEIMSSELQAMKGSGNQYG